MIVDAIVNDDDAMDVVGHDNPRIEGYAGRVSGDGQPMRLHHAAEQGIIEQAFEVVGADGDEIGTGLGVIVTTHANATAMVSTSIVSPHRVHLRGRRNGRRVSS